MRPCPMTNPHPQHAFRLFRITLFIPLAALLVLLPGCSNSIDTPTNRYALVIGVQDYESISINDLKYPDDDAREMTSLLEARGWTVVNTLINKEATYVAIQSAIAGLSQDSGATILVYYSGHGTLEGETPYILPYDVSFYSTSKWITPATLSSWISAIPARQRILILDSCYSGGFSLSDGAVDTSPVDYSASHYTTTEKSLVYAALSKFGAMVSKNLSTFGGMGIQTLAAAGSEEASYDDPAHLNGAFTYYLMEAATYGDADGDGYVTVDEAYTYTKTNIKNYWNATYKANDEDFLPHISGGTGDIVLYAR
jgi:uncharacterized caspase-like protein